MGLDGVWFADQEVDGILITVRPQVIFNRRMAYVRLRWDPAAWSGKVLVWAAPNEGPAP